MLWRYGREAFRGAEDLAKAVELPNLIIVPPGGGSSGIHMPVPSDRHDRAYFAPLGALEGCAGTELFLGVVHAADGVEGTVRRMRAASDVTPDFGIATECGLVARARLS